ncbi:Sir2 family NAD-dependent protein deacetylase [Haloarcula halophila]|uniref:Sir2 family NAD-dependent protein deacetylase n=1 Tax=Haloarcula TaxID=2237 RepID=UPI0023E37268|nr:Sir2 family NAD-dependent protein deacetylase [Halomicroarcula sp. DFY41]
MTTDRTEPTPTVDEGDVDTLAEYIGAASSTVALTGAGVSTASGIPSFRGEDGLWDRFDPMDFHRRRFDADPEGFWQDRLSLRTAVYGDHDPEPNAAHRALVDLESMGALDAVLTQNTDGLHDAAGSERVVELHGTNRRVVCDDCGDRADASPVFERVGDGDCPPRCGCGGVYKPDVVLFGESLPEETIATAQRLAQECDLLLAAGTSLAVRPVSLLPKLVVDGGGSFVVLNLEETERDALADLVVRGDVTAVLPSVVDRL